MRELARQLVKKGAIKMPKEGEEGALDFGLDVDDDDEIRENYEDDGQIPSALDGDGGEGTEKEEDEEKKAVTNAVLVSQKWFGKFTR